jgi:integrase
MMTSRLVDAICEALHNDDYAVLLVRFLAYTGLRVGEVAGLNMADVDLDARTVTVRRTWSHSALSEPKSQASRRTVPLDPELLPPLRAHKVAHPDSATP